MTEVLPPTTVAAPDDPVREAAVTWIAQASLLVVEGADRARFLNAVVTQDLAGLGPGGGAYGALADDRGHALSDFRVYAGEEFLLLELPVAASEPVYGALERLVVADDVRLGWSELGMVAVESADAARAVLALEAAGAPAACEVAWLAAPEPGLYAPAGAAGPVPGMVLRASRLGAIGAALTIARADAPRALELAAGAGAVAAGRALVSRLEIEAGCPGIETEFARAGVLPELGLAGAVSFDKGCYPGQEILNRLRTRGRLQRRLAGVILEDSGGEAWSGAELESPDSAGARAGSPGSEGAPAGTVTRAAYSPSLRATVALAFVRRDFWEPGTELAARKEGGRTTARVARLPFVEYRGKGAARSPWLAAEET